jgi:hypothetical protein
MNESPKARRVYVVVDVMHGVAVDAYTFAKLSTATECLQQLRQARNLDEDDVQLFETHLGEFPEPSALESP